MSNTHAVYAITGDRGEEHLIASGTEAYCEAVVRSRKTMRYRVPMTYAVRQLIEEEKT